MAIELIPASTYTIDELTAFYNQTRVDYMVPMPMNAARLREYVTVYDIDLDQSLVAKFEGEVVGLCMLGVREDRTWITRLGVIPTQRRVGAGRALMEGMIENTEKLGKAKIQLEVIAGNKPAHRLFTTLGFEGFRELLILRRAPTQVPESTSPVHHLELDRAHALLKTRRGLHAWTNQTESLEDVKGLSAFEVNDPAVGYGWMVYQRTLFNLSRLMFETDSPMNLSVMHEVLRTLHNEHPALDTHTENIPADDLRLEAFWNMGYIESFRRVEMVRMM